MRRGRQGLLGEHYCSSTLSRANSWVLLTSSDNAPVAVQTLGQMMAMQPQFGVSSYHLGVIFMVDR